MQHNNFSASIHASRNPDARPAFAVERLEPDGGTVVVKLSPHMEHFSDLVMFIRGKEQLEHMRKTVADGLAKLDELIKEEPLP